MKVVQRAIRRFGKPHTIWSDNGGENRREFLRAMQVKGIRNDKIESLRPGIEKGLSWNKSHACIFINQQSKCLNFVVCIYIGT